ncbi:hypothetical protein BC962_3277 [Gillisia mitskevichiae]|uniref:Uncharacterized protein n=1 Tax=Gillisia mitskevichiae TaxID=270921 RepID=A0A495NZ98_9FLAO|nr:hypothetical protein [Gillisia mitskevichiae]RKS42488.1 hypothetical protein BC962_3277 [Gillisia mitskevichiae]
MNFSTSTHKIIKEKLSTTALILWVGIVIFSLTFLAYFIDSNISPTNQLEDVLFPFYMISFLPITFSYFYQFIDFENIEILKKEYLEINENNLILNFKDIIRYEDITDIQIVIDAYYNQRINMAYRTPTEQKSLGVKNYIKIVTSTQSLNFHFKLENQFHQNSLEEIILKIVTENKLNNIDSKKSIGLIPNRFKNTDIYKSYVIAQIRSKRINCTEGLLLHGYESDKVAKDLRKKYCG